MKLSLVIPAYNEADGVEQTKAALEPVLARLREHYDVEVVFVNDGSSDKTAQLLGEAFANDEQVQVVSHNKNYGLGMAIRTGFKHSDGDIVLTTDFDGTYPFETIPEMLQKMVTTGADIITASPYHPQGRVDGVPKYRLLFSFGASSLYRLLVSRHIHTWTALFRAYRRNVVQNVTFEQTGFLGGTELLVNALRAGYSVTEYPTTLYTRTFGQSSIRIAQVTTAHLKFLCSLLGNDIKKLFTRDHRESVGIHRV